MSLNFNVRDLRVLRNDLKNVPVFDNLTVVIKAKDVNPGIILIPRPLLMTVQHYQVSFRDRSHKLNLFAGALSRHAFEILKP